MSNADPETLERPAQHPVATILRSRGFVPLPRLWVRSEDMPTIHQIAGQYREEVNSVRAQVGHEAPATEQGAASKPIPKAVPKPDPKSDSRLDKDAAWDAMERLRASA